MMQMSSAIAPVCGKSSEISWPLWPHFRNAVNGPRSQFGVLKLGELLPFGQRLGERLAVKLLQGRLPVKGLELRGSARHAEMNHSSRLDREIGPGDDAARFSRLGAGRGRLA